MVQISGADVFIFFGGIVLGALIGIAGNFVVESFFKLKNFEKFHLWIIFIVSLIVFVILIACCFMTFIAFSASDNNMMSEESGLNTNLSCDCNSSTCTINYYVYNISQITVENRKISSIADFKNIFHNMQPEGDYVAGSRVTSEVFNDLTGMIERKCFRN